MDKVTCGVYFLFDHGELVYIGQSTNMLMRIGQHIQEGVKSFDSFEVYPTEKYVALESRLIDIFHPKYNSQRGSRTFGNPESGLPKKISKAIEEIERGGQGKRKESGESSFDAWFDNCCIDIHNIKDTQERRKYLVWKTSRNAVTVRKMYKVYEDWVGKYFRGHAMQESAFRVEVSLKFGDDNSHKRKCGLVYSDFLLNDWAENTFLSPDDPCFKKH